MAIDSKTIGNITRDYQVIQDWVDFVPAGVNASGNSYVGNVMADGEFVGTTPLVVIVGKTCDVDHTITFTAGSSQSFRDNPNVRNNPLFYNAANGAAIRTSVLSSAVITDVDAFTTVSKLQARSTGSTGRALSIDFESNGPIQIENCIFVSDGEITAIMGSAAGRTITVNNCIFIAAGASALRVMFGSVSGGTQNYNFCSFIGATGSGPPTNAFESFAGATVNLSGCAIFGCTNITDGTGTFTFDHCGTDLSAPAGTGNVGGLTFGNQFVSSTNDFRVKTGSGLISGAIPIAGIADDISGLTRNVSTPTIGAWEFASSTAGVPVWLLTA